MLLFASVSFSTDLVLYCEAFLTTYRTFITPEDLIKKLHYRYPFQITQHVTLGLIIVLLAGGCFSCLVIFKKNRYLPRKDFFIFRAFIQLFQLQTFMDGDLQNNRNPLLMDTESELLLKIL